MLVGDGGEILGRVNLVDVLVGSAELGYRIAQRAAGQGLASRAVREVCDLAVTAYGLTTLRAETTVDNLASRNVLARSGFVATGEKLFEDRPGITYRWDAPER